MTSEQRARYRDLVKEMHSAVLEFKELPDGYAARFPLRQDMITLLAEFISLERLCCPFFTLRLEIEREQGPLWLSMTGREGVKAFIRADFGMTQPS